MAEETHAASNAVAAVAIVILVVLALAAGWVLLVNEGVRGARDLEIDLPGPR